MILSSKLHMPKLNENVYRERLCKFIKKQKKLTLISAPAGFGKTTLISQWLTHKKYEYCWFSIDKRDNDLRTFFHYIIASLKTLNSKIGDKVQSLLQSSDEIFPELIVDLLAQDLPQNKRYILVLDDYHNITDENIHRAVNFLLDHIVNLHLVILTRIELPFSISRLRLSYQVTDIDKNDLLFSKFEIIDILKKLNVSKDSVEEYVDKAEGWIVPIKLIALHKTNKENFLQKKFNSQKYLLEYLLEEVFLQQSQKVQEVLLYTSILDRFTEELVHKVLQLSQYSYTDMKILEFLTSLNMFIISLDEKLLWYRYHHLFQDFLQQQLQKKYKGILKKLHQVAGEWFLSQGLLEEAVTHILATRDENRAVRIIEDIWEKLVVEGDIHILYKMLESFPETIYFHFPKISCIYAYTMSFQLEKQDDFNKILQFTQKNVAKNSVEHSYTLILQARSYLWKCNNLEVKTLINQALKHLKKDCHPLFRELAFFLMAGAYLIGEMNIRPALMYVNKALKIMKNRILYYDLICNHIHILISSGKFNQAVEVGKKTLAQLEIETKIKKTYGLAPIHFSLSYIFYLQNKLKESEEHLNLGMKMRGLCDKLDIQAFHCEVQLKIVKRDFEGAYYSLRKAEKLIVKLYIFQMIGSILYFKMILSQLAPHLSFLLEEVKEQVEKFKLEDSLLRAWLSFINGEFKQTIEILDRERKVWSFMDKIDMWLLKAITYSFMKRPDEALESLSNALELAQPQCCISIFLNKGDVIYFLLKKLSSNNFINKVIHAFETRSDMINTTPNDVPRKLIEPLKEREKEILLLISRRYTYREIAEKLYLSINTIKWYVKIIFEKLAVNNKKDAIKQAYELAILT